MSMNWKSIISSRRPETWLIVDYYANKSPPELIFFALLLFPCFCLPFPPFLLPIKKVLLSVYRSCYLIKLSKHSSCLNPPLFFLSLIRDSIKKVNEVCGVLVFTIFIFFFFSFFPNKTCCSQIFNVCKETMI